MKYEYAVMQDGYTYEPGVEVPDLGSVRCIQKNGNKRKYAFLSKDLDKLPTYDNLSSGSSALATDTNKVYVYESTSKVWYMQGE